jgi:hypothetical protein
MSITEQDELEHPASDDWLWRESLYFSFHDTSGRVGGMTTLGVRPNQDRVEGFSAIFLDAHQVLFYPTERRLEEGKAGLLSVPGIAYEMLTPLQKWRFEVSADFSEIDPYQFAQGVQQPKITIPACFDLTFDALSPAYEFPPAFGLLAGAAQHYDQNGRVEGRVTLGGRTFDVDGFGFRDHSWGIRDLSKAGHIVALFAQLGPRLTVNVIWGLSEGQEIAIGYIFRDGENIPIDGIQVAVETDPLSKLPTAAQAEIRLVDGQRFNLEAQITSIMPIILNQGEDQLHWYECLTHFSHGQQRGYGITEITKLVRRELDTSQGGCHGKVAAERAQPARNVRNSLSHHR